MSDNRQRVTSVEVRRKIVPNYREVIQAGLISILPMAKQIAEDEILYLKYSGANEEIVWEDDKWVYNDTKKPVEEMTRGEFNNVCETTGGQNCNDIFNACLTATNKDDANDAANRCTVAIKNMGPRFFEIMRENVGSMHPSQAITFLSNLGFRGVRRNGMDGFETPGSWRRNLSTLLACDNTSDDLCSILQNLKLNEYIETVWAHVHNNPQMLNKGKFHGHHNTDKDKCCDVPGYDIKVKRNVPGKVASLKRLAYQIRRQNNLRFAMMGIPQALITANLVGGGAHLLTNLETYNMSTGADVVNEYLKQIPTASSQVSEVLNMALKESKRVGRDLNNDEVVKDMKFDLQMLSKIERKLRRMTVALAALVDKMSLSGNDVVSDNVTREELEKVWSAAQRYTIKHARTTNKVAENLDGVADRIVADRIDDNSGIELTPLKKDEKINTSSVNLKKKK